MNFKELLPWILVGFVLGALEWKKGPGPHCLQACASSSYAYRSLVRRWEIIYFHSPFTCYLVPCGPYSILFGCWEKRQQGLSHNTHSYLLNKGLARCLWLLTYGLYPPRSISAVDIRRVWRELGFPCLFSSNGASHMAKPGVEVASKSRSLADMTLGRQPGTKMTE